ncbi:MAG: hypothetical protein ACFFAJ_12110 [Candidatus Hodarchaeota archaeon]
MDYCNRLEPITERIGLFSDESSLKNALKEISNSKVSIKRSTRGFSLLYDNKIANPVIAGKERAKVEKILHDVHWRYVKHIAFKHLKNQGFNSIEINEKENQVDLVFRRNMIKNENQTQIITIICSKKKWEIIFGTSGIDKPSSQKFISSLEARLGKSS